MATATREAYGKTLAKLIVEHDDLFVLDADLTKSTKTIDAKNARPEHHFNMGIAEGNMMAVAAGMAASNKVVYASSFAMFAAGRAFEQIRNSICYPNLNVKVCATHAGITVGEDGATHQCIEDIALMNVIPNMKIFCPADDISTKKILGECLGLTGPKYVRLGRAAMPDVYSYDEEFHLGGSKTFGNGTDGTIFAVGSTVNIALDAKVELEKSGINVRVVDLYSIKPVDEEEILKSAKQTEKLVSIEDHSVIGGIGSIIESVLCKRYPKKLVKLGVKDIFGKSGKPDELYAMYGITKEEIIKNFI